MTSKMFAATAAALIAGATAVVAQPATQIDEECRNQAERMGLTETHNVTYDRDRNVCVAVPIFGGGMLPGVIPGLAGGGTGAVAAAAGVLAFAAIAADDGTTVTTTTVPSVD